MSKDIASSGMMEFLDAFERSRDLRDDFDIVVAKEGKAADILQVFVYRSEISFFKNDSRSWKMDPSYGDLLQR